MHLTRATLSHPELEVQAGEVREPDSKALADAKPHRVWGWGGAWEAPRGWSHNQPAPTTGGPIELAWLHPPAPRTPGRLAHARQEQQPNTGAPPAGKRSGLAKAPGHHGHMWTTRGLCPTASAATSTAHCRHDHPLWLASGSAELRQPRGAHTASSCNTQQAGSGTMGSDNACQPHLIHGNLGGDPGPAHRPPSP